MKHASSRHVISMMVMMVLFEEPIFYFAFLRWGSMQNRYSFRNVNNYIFGILRASQNYGCLIEIDFSEFVLYISGLFIHSEGIILPTPLLHH